MSDAPERLHQLRELFDAVMDRPAAERGAYLESASEWDASLRREVLALIASADATATRLAAPWSAYAFPSGGADGPLVGHRVGAYDMVRLVGTGGMGAVYEAVRADDQYRKRVAIKVVQRGVDSELALGRFRRERQILANLDHPNIARLLDGGVTADGRPFLVMEYVEGEPITVWCDARAYTTRDRVALVGQVCEAVRHAHANLVVHGDLKPGNILVSADGTAKLLDFGIAKLIGDEAADDAMPLTRGGARPFTPEYASPEQLRGDALTTASDVYSLGVVLYELLVGHRPFRGAGRTALAGPPTRPSAAADDEAAARRGERSGERLRGRLRGELDQIVLMALRAEPEQRYASVEALADDLRRYLDGRPVAAQRGWAGYRFRKFARRNLAAVTASALVLVALVGGVVATTAQARRARTEQIKSERVSGFLRELLSSVRPTTGGRDLPVSEVLDGAARRMETALADQPDVRAELETVIGQSYQALGRYDEAAGHLTHALALREQVAGARSASAAVGLSNVAGLYMARGEIDRADTLFRRGLAIARARGGAAPDTLLASLLDNLGSIAHNRGQDADAERLHRQALAIRRTLFDANDDMIAYSLNNVAVALGDQNRLAAAESLHRAAVAILRANHRTPYPLVADAENALATALDLQGKNVAAESMYVDVIALRRQLLGPEHPDYAWTVFNYASFEYDLGHYREAMDRSREVLALRGPRLPESHAAVAGSLQTVGRCLDRLGDTDGGGRALEESLALRRRYLPPTSWLIANSEGVLGEHYTLVKQFARSERLLLHADSVLVRALGPANPRTLTNVRRIVSLYEAWGQPGKGAGFRARLATS